MGWPSPPTPLYALKSMRQGPRPGQPGRVFEGLSLSEYEGGSWARSRGIGRPVSPNRWISCPRSTSAGCDRSAANGKPHGIALALRVRRQNDENPFQILMASQRAESAFSVHPRAFTRLPSST